MLHDVRFALRTFRRRPGVAALVVSTLAIGIAASTTMFTVADAILWHPLPFRDPNRLVALRAIATGQPSAVVPLAVLDAWSSKDRALTGLSSYALLPGLITGAGEPELGTICELSASALPTLDVVAAIGRVFTTADQRPDTEPVVVLSDAFWRSRYGASSGAIGRTISVDARPYTIVGVAPAGFQFPVDRVLLWLPLRPGRDRVGAFARLAPGVSLREAQAAADTIPADVTDERGRPLPRVQVVPFTSATVETATALRVLFGAVALLLLIAVGNAGNILLAEAVRRDAEMAVRVSLGAGWRRLAQQVLVETLLLSAAAAVAATALSWWAIRGLVTAMPYVMHFTALRPITVDWRALVFTSGVAAGAGIAAGIGSLVRAASADVHSATKGMRPGAAAHGRVRGALTVLQMAVAVVLLAAAGLLANGFVRLAYVSPGFTADHLIQVSLYLPTWRFPDAVGASRWLDRVKQEAFSVPDVVSATMAGAIPPRLGFRTARFETLDGGAPAADEVIVSDAQVDDTFFSTLGIPVLAGRAFDRGDAASGQPSAIVGEALARRLWPRGDAVGRRFRLGASDPWLTVVGVAGNVRNGGVDAALGELALYTPRAANAAGGFEGLVVRSRSEPGRVAPALRDLIRRLDAEVPIVGVETAYETIATSNARVRFATLLMAGFAAVAMLLAMVGVYGAFWCAVRQRAHELGVRAALGARPADVVRLVLAESGRLALLGVAFGLPSALAATQLMRTLLFNVSPTDPLTFLLVCTLLFLASLAAASIPAYAAMVYAKLYLTTLIEEYRKAVRGLYNAFHRDDSLRNPADEVAAFSVSCNVRDMGTHLWALRTGEGLVCLGCTHAQPK